MRLLCDIQPSAGNLRNKCISLCLEESVHPRVVKGSDIAWKNFCDTVHVHRGSVNMSAGVIDTGFGLLDVVVTDDVPDKNLLYVYG